MHLSRKEKILQASADSFDLIIIGGGITGAGIALDAATRGLKVLLLEKMDFSEGTSSRSTKLIHGGLRYLKQFEISLVREVGRERAVVYRNARHLVKPERMLLPIVENGSLGKFMTSVGLWVYDFLAGVEKDERRRMLSKEDTLAQEPLLRKDIVKGGGLYYEYRTDDSRLTLSILTSATEAGAICLNYAPVTEFIYQDELLTGVKFQDRLSGETYKANAKIIVNAAGPWVDKLRNLDILSEDSRAPKKKLHLTKGVHLVVPREKLPLHQSVYFDVPDGRMIFAIPRDRITYIGTTDTHYTGNTEDPITDGKDVDYLLQAVNNMFPDIHLQAADIESSWAGLRPLIHEAGKNPSELSRRDEIFQSETGLISIAGGKLTGYRKMAERITDLVCKKLHVPVKCKTHDMRIAGGHFESDEEMNHFITTRIGEAKQVEMTKEDIIRLFNLYGSNIDIIIEKAYELFATEKDARYRTLEAEIWYAVHREMAVSLSDFVIRRTGLIYFNRPELKKHTHLYARIMGKVCNWSEDKIKHEEESLLFMLNHNYKPDMIL
jgi:glycerol-3-phosphate dehydrogenase